VCHQLDPHAAGLWLSERACAELRHDLRTPVSAIIGLSRLLLDGADGSLSAEQRRQVQLIHDAAMATQQAITERLAPAGSGRSKDEGAP